MIQKKHLRKMDSNEPSNLNYLFIDRDAVEQGDYLLTSLR